jgi:hypothetical protein
MRKLIVAAAAAGAISAAGLGLAWVAAAAPIGGTSGAVTGSTSQSDGAGGALDVIGHAAPSRCAVSNVHGLPVIDSAGRPNAISVVFVGAGCAN